MQTQTAAAEGWDLYSIARAADPHARWRALREREPVHAAGRGVFLVTRWDLVHQVLHDPRVGAGRGVAASFGDGEGRVFDVMRAWLMSLDGAPHQRARDLVRREFTPRRIDALQPRIEALADELVHEIERAPDGRVDLMRALALPLPSQVIRGLFGIERETWARSVEVHFAPGAAGARDALAMLEALTQYFEGRLGSGVEAPEGLLAKLQRADPELGSLSRLEVVANAVLLVSAAIDTTAGLIGSAIRCVLERPALLARLRDDPSLVPAVVEETLRFEAPALSCSRHAAEPLTLGGVAIPAGSQLLLSLAAANRDPARYPDPDLFDIGRDHTGLLSFGGGRHFCLGAALARSEAACALTRLLVDGACDLVLEEPPVWDFRNPTVRALARLPVRVGPR